MSKKPAPGARFKSLNPKQQAFVREYLIDINGAQAAIRAGYSRHSAKDQAKQNLEHPVIAGAVRDALAKRAERTEVTADRVVQELAKIGFADIRQVVRWGHSVAVDDDKGESVVTNGVVVIDSQELSEAQAAAIAEVSEGPNGIRVKMHDKQAALVSLCRHLGLFTDRTEITGKDGAPIVPILNVYPAGSEPGAAPPPARGPKQPSD